MNESSPAAVSLAPPGAGLPWFEELVLRNGLRLYSRLRGREEVLAKFLSEGERVLSLAAPLDEATGRKPVLVRRVFGMEDSSRCWSPYMIVQHLVIVNRGMLGMILLLSSGKTTKREVSTADVKPSPDAGPEALDEFREMLARWQETLAGIPELRTKGKASAPVVRGTGCAWVAQFGRGASWDSPEADGAGGGNLKW